MDTLKHPNFSIVKSKESFYNMWADIVLQELKRIIYAEIVEFRFSFKHDTDEPKIEDHIIRLLELYSPGQIYCLFWMAIRQADNNRTSGTWGNYTYHHIDFILKKVEETESKKQKMNEPIKSFDYPRNLNTTLLTNIFFQEVARESNWFDNRIPGKELVGLHDKKIPFYDDLKDREVQTFNGLGIMEINYYYFTSYGVVINDGLVDWLFADEKTLYSIAQQVGFSGTEDVSESAYLHLNVPYYIHEIYSTRYLLSLVQFLVDSEYEQYLPPKDAMYKDRLEGELHDNEHIPF
ncbi:hypothetical protein [Gracilibacillus pellucidus]|uniref:hypothetical protein n=1 Tax=Gracilibacillus pellucidus TaxID=3095368 RepID=UPI0029F57CA5|nr:hypothetical protein [Gracilibacillus sp. S3-1-1]